MMSTEGFPSNLDERGASPGGAFRLVGLKKTRNNRHGAQEGVRSGIVHPFDRFGSGQPATAPGRIEQGVRVRLRPLTFPA